MWEYRMKIRLALAGMGMASIVSGAALAGPELQAEIAAGCMASLNWSESACACAGAEAAVLNDAQQGFLAATLNEQEAEANAYAMEMSPAETMQASMFMMNAGPGCQ
jgi:hypothetical protein